MFNRSNPFALLPTRRRHGPVMLAGLVGAAMAFAPALASAQDASHYHHHVWGKTAHESEETIDLRISDLHTRLHITPDEETAWSDVAQTMRDNEAHMQELIAAREAEPEHHVSAPEDLRVYEHFTQAHVEGLKLLRSSFETLYTAMPDAQKLVADDVFDKFGNGHD